MSNACLCGTNYLIDVSFCKRVFFYRRQRSNGGGCGKFERIDVIAYRRWDGKILFVLGGRSLSNETLEND